MDHVHQKIHDYTNIYHQLKQKLKWSLVDDRVLMMVAANYVVSDRAFNLSRFVATSEHIKREVGAFSTLKNYHRYTTAAMLDVRYEEPEAMFAELLSVYEELVKGGFGRGAFTYIAALVLLSKGNDNRECMVQRAHQIYQAMKKRHFFLTSASDYPLAALLAVKGDEIESLMGTIERYYDQLSVRGFRKGNDLQFLSHILSVDESQREQYLMERCDRIFELLKQHGIKPKPMYYPEIGLLALFKESEKELNTIKEMLDQLNRDKRMKWQKDINFMMVVNFFISSKTKNASLLETEIYTTMETLIQAQQAAMVATTTTTSSGV